MLLVAGAGAQACDEPECADAFPRCYRWAADGNCDALREFMHRECAASCGLCEHTPSDPCEPVSDAVGAGDVEAKFSAAASLDRYKPSILSRDPFIVVFDEFIGGSLGWHDFLASTARLFRHDPDYRIPVKADPDIVIRNIRESHAILVRDLGESGALKIGGMYGILYQSGDIESFAACMVGYIRDVVTQLKRGLDGFWVAHPDFVRIGIALVEAWKQQQADPSGTVLHDLVRALVP